MGYILELRKKVGQSPLIMNGSSVLLLDQEQRLLLQRRTDNQTWGLPGGSMEPGETFEETAARELYEETGLRAGYLEFMDIFSGAAFYYRYPNGDEVYNVIAAYICEDFTGELDADEEEVAALRFFRLDELPDVKVINPADGPVIGRWLELRNRPEIGQR